MKYEIRNGTVDQRGNENSQGHLTLRKHKLCLFKRPVCKFLDFLPWKCHSIWQQRRLKEEDDKRSGSAKHVGSCLNVHPLGVNQWFVNLKMPFLFWESSFGLKLHKRKYYLAWERKELGSHEFGRRFFYHGGIAIRDSGSWEHDCDLVIPVLGVLIGGTG